MLCYCFFFKITSDNGKHIMMNAQTVTSELMPYHDSQCSHRQMKPIDSHHIMILLVLRDR